MFALRESRWLVESSDRLKVPGWADAPNKHDNRPATVTLHGLGTGPKHRHMKNALIGPSSQPINQARSGFINWSLRTQAYLTFSRPE